MTRPKSIALDFDKTIFGGEFTSVDVVEGPPIVGAIEYLAREVRSAQALQDRVAELEALCSHFEHLKGSKGRL